MKTIEATYRIVTPMFIGGADSSPSDGIRPPSFKGALRFWWRALNWGEYQDLTALHQKEEELFGSADTGQGTFLLAIQSESLQTVNAGEVHSEFSKNDAARYLGYGLMGAFGANSGKLERGCISQNQAFTVQLMFRKEVEPSIIDALKVLGLLGGLGSRSRKGLGSIAIESLMLGKDVIWSKPNSHDEYQREISMLFENVQLDSKLPPFTAFSSQTQVDCLLESPSSIAVLNEYGKGMMMYRSWGKNGKVLRQPREENFKGDHDWSKGSMPEGFHPRRVVFGLPHNYGKHESMHVDPAQHKRRSAPLIFHVHQVGERFVGVSIIFPADFLPAGEKIKAGKKIVNSNIEWKVLQDFIIGNNAAEKPRFPSRTTVSIGDKV